MNNTHLFEFLAEATAVPGLPGFESESCALIADWFQNYSADVWQDAFGNVYARTGGSGPKLFVSAHFDGLGLIVRSVEDDGFLGLATLGGFDSRTLPGRQVTVHARGGDLTGIIGAKPPHVLSAEDMKTVLTINDLFVDIGFSPERVKELVRVGDTISIPSPLVQLQGDVVAGRALDDRAGIAVLLDAMKRLQKTPCDAQVIFCASTQEEVGARGAQIAAYGINPDLAIAVDVCHAVTPKAPAARTVPYDRPAIARGVTVDRRVSCRLEQVAKDLEMEYSVEVSPGGSTGTDMDEVSLVRCGVPSGVLSIPQKYMHTTVECLKLSSVRKCGKLIAGFAHSLQQGWEDWPCE
ncbi:MAG: M20/M25/M40 family metallo-hydrolase [Eubacteriales bacterium]|nr:M20/M25/M40 family metallo-hydrolase [Eubacteriales bacterium]